jgi:peptide/nickel transport system permease protein
VKFVLRKAGFYAIAVWAAVTLNFLLPRLLPGNPVDAILARTQSTTPLPPSARAALDIQFGVSNDPLPVQYLKYLNNMVHGNFGLSVTFYPTPVSTVVREAIPWTLALIGLSTIISFVVGICLGALAGWRRGTWLDAIVPSTTLLQAVPYFWLALLLLYFLAEKWQLFPLSGGYDLSLMPSFKRDFLGSAIYHGILPAMTIVISQVAGWLLGMRNMMVSTMFEDYVLTAEAKGLRPSRVMMRYAARNAVLPSVTGFAISIGFIVSGSIITETVFSYPGVGYNLLTAVQNSDYPLMQALFLVITLAVLAANFLVDLMNGFIDPRTRQRG